MPGEAEDGLFDAQSLEAKRRNGYDYESYDGQFDSENLSDGENVTVLEGDIRKVMSDSGTDDMVIAKSALESNALCVEAAVDYLLQLKSLGGKPLLGIFRPRYGVLAKLLMSHRPVHLQLHGNNQT